MQISERIYWYRLEILNGDESYCFFGSSLYAEDEFVRRLNSQEYLRLDNIIFYDEEGEAKSWAEWDPNYIPRAYVNPRYVVSLMPLAADPRKSQGGFDSKILNLPGTPPGDN